jgi:hypothetical protein
MCRYCTTNPPTDEAELASNGRSPPIRTNGGPADRSHAIVSFRFSCTAPRLCASVHPYRTGRNGIPARRGRSSPLVLSSLPHPRRFNHPPVLFWPGLVRVAFQFYPWIGLGFGLDWIKCKQAQPRRSLAGFTLHYDGYLTFLTRQDVTVYPIPSSIAAVCLHSG